MNNFNKVYKSYSVGLVVIDACIGIKWFSSVNEEKVEYATLIQRKNINLELEIVIPDLFIYEILNTLLIKKKSSVDDLKLCRKALSLMNLNIVIPDDKLLDLAIELANILNLTYYDGIYLALAKRMDTILITEDKKILSCSHKCNFIKSLEYVQNI